MDKVIVLGGDGQLGHILYDFLYKNNVDVYKTTRDKTGDIRQISRFDVNNFEDICFKIDRLNPYALINCIGAVKQKTDDIDNLIKINSIFPHKLNEIYGDKKRIIHISSDCVFNGLDGGYNELSLKNAIDCYGYSKGLGEIIGSNTITLRTSFIGPEMHSCFGLFNWFLMQDSVSGFSKAYFSGITSLELSNIIYFILNNNLNGIYNVAGEKISKCELLKKINNIFCLGKEIREDDSFVIDRSLNGEKFYNDAGYKIKNWDYMIQELKLYIEEREYGF